LSLKNGQGFFKYLENQGVYHKDRLAGQIIRSDSYYS